MARMDEAAPPEADFAARATAPLTSADPVVNDLHDRLNAMLPWLWTPLDVPEAVVPLAGPHHALYAVHSAVPILVTLALGRRRTAAVLTGAAIISWAVFTGAWNRRAGQEASAARRER